MPTQRIKLLGYAPDAAPDTPGVITSSVAVIPTSRGFASGMNVTSKSKASAASLVAISGWSMATSTGASRNFAGTATKLFEDNGSGTLTDLSGAATFNASSSQTWSFTSFGDVALAVDKGDNLLASTASLSNFATVSGAPKADIVVTCGEPNASFVMCFNYNDGTNNYVDGVSWSALGDYTSWTPSLATQAGNIRLEDIGGAFTAAIAYRDGVVAFKRRGMYLGTYVGGAAVWDWTRISAEVGCISKSAVCEADDVLYFGDANGLWMYDGSFPRPMPGAVHNYWAAQFTSSSVVAYAAWEKPGRRVWFGLGSSGQPASFLAYHTRAQRWTNYGQMSNNGATLSMELLYNDPYGSLMGVNGLGATPQIASVVPSTTNAAPGGNVMLSPIGSPYGIVQFNSIRPQFFSGPSDTAAGWLSGKVYYGPSLRNVTNASINLTFTAPGRLDGIIAGKWVQPQLTFTSLHDFEIGDVFVDLSSAGDE